MHPNRNDNRNWNFKPERMSIQWQEDYRQWYEDWRRESWNERFREINKRLRRERNDKRSH